MEKLRSIQEHIAYGMGIVGLLGMSFAGADSYFIQPAKVQEISQQTSGLRKGCR